MKMSPSFVINPNIWHHLISFASLGIQVTEGRKTQTKTNIQVNKKRDYLISRCAGHPDEHNAEDTSGYVEDKTKYCTG